MKPPEKNSRARLAMVIPNGMAVRTIFETPVLAQLAALDGWQVDLLTPRAEDAARIASLQAPHLRWRAFQAPAMPTRNAPAPGRRLLSGWHRALEATIFRERAQFPNLYYRFNSLSGFTAHRHKMQMSAERRAQEAEAGHYVHAHYGHPRPLSWRLLRAVYAFYYAGWQGGDSRVEAYFDQERPGLVLFVHVQNHAIRPYSVAARRRGVPMLGFITSWTNPPPAARWPLVCAG
ncbi:MAG: hypothetical protein HC915_03205 [Anaerolineae bacterium]|nr:hypothetical protein [Anaerolineae bacterium]